MRLFSHKDKPVDDLIYLEILNAENRKKPTFFIVDAILIALFGLLLDEKLFLN